MSFRIFLFTGAGYRVDATRTGFYIASPNVLIDGKDMYDVGGFGMRLYDAVVVPSTSTGKPTSILRSLFGIIGFMISLEFGQSLRTSFSSRNVSEGATRFTTT